MRAIHQRGEPSDLITEYERRALVSSNRTNASVDLFILVWEANSIFFRKKSMLSIHVESLLI